MAGPLACCLPLYALLFCLLDAQQLSLNIAQGLGNLVPRVLLLFEDRHRRRRRLIIRDMPTRLDLGGFALFVGEGLLQHGLHACGFFKQTRHELAAFLRFHRVLLSGCSSCLHGYWLTPRCRSSCSSSSNTLRISAPPISTRCHRSCSYFKPSSSMVSGAPCVDSSPCSTRSLACRACERAVRFCFASAKRVSSNSIRVWRSMDVLLGVSIVSRIPPKREHKPCQPCHRCRSLQSMPHPAGRDSSRMEDGAGDS